MLCPHFKPMVREVLHTTLTFAKCVSGLKNMSGEKKTNKRFVLPQSFGVQSIMSEKAYIIRAALRNGASYTLSLPSFLKLNQEPSHDIQAEYISDYCF